MKYSDYQVMMKKEYERNRRNIGTCYFFLLLSFLLFLLFFLYIHELTVAGTAFLLDFAAAVYAFRAFKGQHPYWEMQLAIKAKLEPGEMTVLCFTAGVEYALEQSLPAFKGRALEIFKETFQVLKESGKVAPSDLERLEAVLYKAGVWK